MLVIHRIEELIQSVRVLRGADKQVSGRPYGICQGIDDPLLQSGGEID